MGKKAVHAYDMIVPVAKRTVRTSGSPSRYSAAQAQRSIVDTLGGLEKGRRMGSYVNGVEVVEQGDVRADKVHVPTCHVGVFVAWADDQDDQGRNVYCLWTWLAG